jgi:aspartyl aminopeptidase
MGSPNRYGTDGPDRQSAPDVPDTERDALAVLEFIGASPSPFHAVATAAGRLEASGFTPLTLSENWAQRASPRGDASGGDTVPQRGVLRHGGALLAWVLGAGDEADQAFRVLGAHTDSPNLRIKPRPDTGRVGYRQLGVEVYGGALLNSWLDRDLGLSGRVVVHDGTGTDLREELVIVGDPLLRIPQLAIHLDREVNEKGLVLNRQQHLSPVWGLGASAEGDLADHLSTIVGGHVVSWDLMCHDTAPGTLLGRDRELLASARIDNLASCWAAVEVLAGLDPRDDPHTTVVCLYDHEEVGSQSATGADSSLLLGVLERLCAARGGDRGAFLRALAGSWCLSVDGAHATHPNYPERHEPAHLIRLNGGPVLKHNSNERYATHAPGAAAVALAAATAEVELQHFVNRTDLGCGSTIGPTTAARLGMGTVDLGLPMLSMHSTREMCGANDPAMLRRLLEQLCRLPPAASP